MPPSSSSTCEQKRHRMLEKQNDLKEVIVHLRTPSGAPAGPRDLSGNHAHFAVSLRKGGERKREGEWGRREISTERNSVKFYRFWGETSVKCYTGFG